MPIIRSHHAPLLCLVVLALAAHSTVMLAALPAWATDPLMDFESGELAAFVRSGAATYIDADGVMRTAAENEPRLQYVRGLGLALLLEGAATNLYENGQKFWSTSDYGKGYAGYGMSSVWTYNAAQAPNGQMQATEVVMDTSSQSASHGKYTISSSGIFSVYAKTEDVPVLGFTSHGYTFNLTPDWERYEYAERNTSIGDSHCKFIYDGKAAGHKLYIWGAQYENTEYVTSYIPSDGFPASRATEAADETGNGWSFALGDNPDLAAIFEGSGRVEFTFVPGHDLAHVSGSPGLISVADGPDLVYVDGSGIACTDGTNTAAKDMSYTAGNAYDIEVRWDGGKMAVAVDGEQGAEMPFDGSFDPGTHLRLSWANPYPWQMRELAFYDAASGSRVAYWPLNGTKYEDVAGDDEKPQAGIMKPLGLKPFQAVPMRALPLSGLP